MERFVKVPVKKNIALGGKFQQNNFSDSTRAEERRATEDEEVEGRCLF